MKQILILLAEDNLGDQKLVSMALRERDHTQLATVRDGVEALDYVLRAGKYKKAPRPDLVILDVNLPKKSGLEVLVALRQNASVKDIPVALFTGAKATPEVSELCKEGDTFYVVKPMGLDNYFKVIQLLESFCRDESSSAELRKKLMDL